MEEEKGRRVDRTTNVHVGDGVFLGGVKGSTGKLIIGDKKGVWVTRTVRRKPEEEIWGRENVENIVGGGLEE